jgi:endonuclease YncB( thermonuclease family)
MGYEIPPERVVTTTGSSRLVCMMFVDGTDAGLELIKEGFAWAYAKYLPEASLETGQSYTAAEVAARAARIGLWVDADPQPPWEYRQLEKEQRPALPAQ